MKKVGRLDVKWIIRAVLALRTEKLPNQSVKRQIALEKSLPWVWWPSFACARRFLAVHTHKSQPLSNTAQGGFSEKGYSSSRSKQLPAFGSFSWITSSSFNSQLPFVFISISSHQKRGVNDSLAPNDLLNNWTVMCQCHSAPSLSPFYFPSLALIFTASFSVYMPERLKEAEHLLPLPPRVRQLFTQPRSFLLHHMGDSPPGWDARVLPESLLLDLSVSPTQNDGFWFRLTF